MTITDIKGAIFDLGGAVTQIEDFGYRHMLERTTISKLNVITEELGAIILVDKYQEETDAKMTFSYKEETAEDTVMEDKTMTKTLKVNGMMCEHCEARVKKALEAVDGGKEAVADKDAKTATVTLEKDVAFEVLKAAVEAQDYEVVGEA